MKFISLFAGIGGIDLGLERAGMECVAQVEIDDFCQKVLTKHWPDVPKFKDIRDVGKQNLPAVDLIAGGFPCQPFSVAGKRRGTEDDRHLWPEMLRVIAELKPTWVLGENVPGIIPLFLDQAITDLENQGYACEPIVLPACAFDAQHIRQRLFIVGYSERQPGWKKPKRGVDMGRHILQKQERNQNTNRVEASSISETFSDTNETGLEKRQRENTSRERKNGGTITSRGSTWLPEPDVGRMADGVPNRVDRIKSLGNAVVPQVAEFIGRMIMEAA